jgi:hypothetical protein
MTKFPSFPECCHPILEQLEREGKTGQRNCPKGHAVSLEYARVIEDLARRKPSEPSSAPPKA